MENNKIFYLPITEDTCNYLQRLGMEVDSRLEVINRLFTVHANDPDDSVLTSPAFKTYHKQFDDVNAEYAIAKERFGEEIRPMVEETYGETGVEFNWFIENFESKQVKITIN